MIKVKLFIETDCELFNHHACVEVELQCVPIKGSLFYLTKEHENELKGMMLQYRDEFIEYYESTDKSMYIGDVIYVYEVAMVSDGDIWISLSVDNPCIN